MKLTTLLFFVALFQVSAISYSQQTRLNLKFEKETLESVFSKIEANSEFSIFYKNDLIRNSQEVSGEFKNALIFEILDQVLQAENLTYSVKNKLIMIVPKEGKGAEINLQQQKSVSGKVTDFSGSALPGVSVVIKGTTNGTITDGNGNYSLSNVPENATLQFSFVGMKGQEINVGSKNIINVTLVDETVGIEEVVAVGYGSQKKATVSGSVSSVKGEQLTVAPIASTSNTLAGQLPGLVAKQTNGRPGADAASLSIRGFGSALTIVDGVEADFNTLDPNSIESITILKDGAASIYGARAGNGVILVTTKRGNTDKPVITLNTSKTFQGITIMPKPVSSGQYAEMASEAWLNSGKPASTVPYTQEQIQKYYAGNDPLYPNTNWYNELVRDWAPQQQHNLSVRGGSDKIKYYGFLGYLNQETMWKRSESNYNRYNLQSNIDAKITDELSMQLDFASTYEERNYPYVPQDRVDGSIWQHFWGNLPIYPATLPDPTKVPYGGGDAGANILSDRSLIGYNDSKTQNIKGTIALKYDIKAIKGLSAKAFVNYNQTYASGKVFLTPVTFYIYDPQSKIYTVKGAVGGSKPQLSESRNENRMLTGQFSLNYERLFAEKHKLSVLLLSEMIDYKSNYITASRVNYLTAAVDQLFAGNTTGMANNGAATEMGRKSFVARFNYSYKDKYLFESTMRADASAKFPSDKRWGYFPSVSLGWLVSEEAFMDRFTALDNLKLRTSYGESGNDGVGNFQYLSGYAFGRTYPIGAGPQQGMVSTGLANPFLTWERIKIYNLGADFSFWKRKLYGEFDVFYRERKGIPATKITTLPTTFGASLPPENLNSLNDRGFELKLGTAGKLNDLSWDVSGNISWSRAKWDHYEEPAYTDPEQARVYQNSGKWLDRVYGYKSDGLFTSQTQIDQLTFNQDQQGNKTLRPGDIRYVDVNGDKKLDWKDQVEIGKGNTPHWMLGTNISLKYKDFDFSSQFQGAFGYNTWLSLSQRTVEFYNNRWTSANNNQNAIVPRLGGASTNGYTSDFYYKKAGYIRLKAVSVGYNLPQPMLDKLKFRQVRIYIAGTNLLTFDNLKKYATDPEAPSGGSGMYYPQQKTVSLGVNISL